MKQLLSALMDGELESPAAEKALDGLGKSGELRRDWAVYHLIGDHLRGDPACCLSSRFSIRLASEATVFVPPSSRRNPLPSSPSSPSVSAAVAALLGVLVVAWAAVSLEMTSSGALPEVVSRPVEFRQVAIGTSLPSAYVPLHRVASRSSGRGAVAPVEVVSGPGGGGAMER